MNVLYLTYDGLTDPLGQSQIIPYLAGMSASGFKVAIVSCEKPARLAIEGETISKLLKTHNINWYPVRYTNAIPVLSPILTLYRLFKEGRSVLKKDRPAFIHCRSTLPALVGYNLKLKYKLPLIFDMRGFWADERVEGNIWPQENIVFRYIYRWVKKKEQMLLQESDHIISLTSAAKKIMLNQANTVARPISVIPCCADFNHFNPSDINIKTMDEKRQNLNINNDDFVIIYTGSIGTWYLLDEMMQFFKVFNDRKPQSLFLLVTKENHEMITQSAVRCNVPLEKIRTTSGSRVEMPVLLSLAHLSLYFIKPGYSKQASSPVKQGESLAMGIPVITNKSIGDSDELISQNNLGWQVDSFTTEDFTRTIEKIKLPAKQEIRNKSFPLLSLESGINKYLEIYKSITKN